MEKKNLKPDAILVPCSGGGLAAGIALGVKKFYPNTIIHPVEPQYYDDTRKSLIKGKIISNSTKYHSICDALLVPKPGIITFEINKILLGQGFVVSDKEVIEEGKPHEATLLHLLSEKAYNELQWTPKWDFQKTVSKTVNWYKNDFEGADAFNNCLNDIDSYSSN